MYTHEFIFIFCPPTQTCFYFIYLPQWPCMVSDTLISHIVKMLYFIARSTCAVSIYHLEFTVQLWKE